MDEKKYVVIVKADGNDADYLTNIFEWDEEEYRKYKPYVEKLVELLEWAEDNVEGKHNWPSSTYMEGSPWELYEDQVTQEEWDWMVYTICLVPHGEHGVHTVVDVDVYEITGKDKLF